MRNEKFPVTITEKGVSAVIRQALKIKGGKKLEYFIVEYILLGKRKQVWRSDLDKAKAVAREACIKIANGDQSALELRNGELLAYTRAVEILSPTRVPIDTACREFTDAMQILGGHASIIEACRDWMKRNAVLTKTTRFWFILIHLGFSSRIYETVDFVGFREFSDENTRLAM
jgi:hypothetical protein